MDSRVDVESESSSDRLSAFDTARDYHDLDWVNSLHWYDDTDESHLMTPCYNGSVPFGVPTEDKFIMTSDSLKKHVSSNVSYYEVERGTISKRENEVQPLFVELKSVKDGNEIVHMNCNRYDETLHQKDDFLIGNIDASCQLFQGSIRSIEFDQKSPSLCGSSPWCQIDNTEQADFEELAIDICADSASLQMQVKSPSPVRKLSDAFPDDFGTTSEEIQTTQYESDFHESASLEKEIDSQVVEESNDTSHLGQEENTALNELILYDNPDEEYEVFYLNIIHRKNRLVPNG